MVQRILIYRREKDQVILLESLGIVADLVIAVPLAAVVPSFQHWPYYANFYPSLVFFLLLLCFHLLCISFF